MHRFLRTILLIIAMIAGGAIVDIALSVLLFRAFPAPTILTPVLWVIVVAILARRRKSGGDSAPHGDDTPNRRYDDSAILVAILSTLVGWPLGFGIGFVVATELVGISGWSDAYLGERMLGGFLGGILGAIVPPLILLLIQRRF